MDMQGLNTHPLLLGPVLACAKIREHLMTRLIYLLPALVALTACASTPTLYAPASDGGHGYSQQRIEQDRYRIRFAAGSDMSIREVEDMALLRAAQITVEEGGDWFIVVSRAREGNDRNPVRVGGSVGQSFGSRGRSGSSIGLGIHFDADAGEKTAMLEILIRSGQRDGNPNAYDARQVIDNNPACNCYPLPD
jgi:hypothetical protein